MANHRNPDREERFFNGRRYTRLPNGTSKSHSRYFYCNEWDKEKKRYFQHALHRDIWMDTHGPVPKGCDIHHVDEDFDNNNIDNLECITKSDHHKHHGADPEFKRTMQRWHKENGTALRVALQEATQRPKNYTCKRCGTPFVAKSFKAKFCREIDCVRERWAAQARLQRQRT